MVCLKKFLNNINHSLLNMLERQDHGSNDSPAQEEHEDITMRDTSLSGWFKEETDELLEGFKISPEDVVLDVGCGDSPFLLFCARRGVDVIFADIDAAKMAAMAEILQSSPARSTTALMCDASFLPLKDASVSKIIAMEIMEHVDDPGLFLKELLRVGKPGAQYLITVPDPTSETLQKHIAPPIYFEKPNHIRIISRYDFEKWIVDAGYVVEARRYYGFFWTLWWLFFWPCNQDLSPKWHPLLESWGKTWNMLLKTEQGPQIKKILDNFLPKSQAIIARKPDDAINE